MSATIPIALLFRCVWPEHTAKHAARASGLSVRTAQGWMSQRCTPSAATLLRMAENNDRLRLELILKLTEMQNASMAAGVLPVDGNAADEKSRRVDGPSSALAAEN